MTPLASLSIYWDLPFLLVLVSLVYSATRYDRWDMIVVEAFRWGGRMVSFLAGIGIALFAASRFS